jgi:hypothetical protein
MPEWLVRLESSAITAFLRDSLWIDASLHILHLVGLVMVVGGASILDLRLIGKWNSLPLDGMMRLTIPWVWAGFTLSVLSGVLMFLESPIELYFNTAFRIKLGLLVLVGINAFGFHRFSHARALNGQPHRARLSGWVSLGLWFTIVVFARLIVYT